MANFFQFIDAVINKPLAAKMNRFTDLRYFEHVADDPGKIRHQPHLHAQIILGKPSVDFSIRLMSLRTVHLLFSR